MRRLYQRDLVAKLSGALGALDGLLRGLGAGSGDFGDFLSKALKDGIGTMKQGETMAANQVSGKSSIVDVVSAVNQAEITLDTVVAVRDKVVQAYQSIMNMPI